MCGEGRQTRAYAAFANSKTSLFMLENSTKASDAKSVCMYGNSVRLCIESPA